MVYHVYQELRHMLEVWIGSIDILAMMQKKTDGYIQGCMGIVGYAWQFPQPGIASGSL